uniref:Stabilin 2 n=1 Tax=Eptatretus burgeri TaxID=7764 RepID=A0A8C4PZD7_EPTBU
MLFLSHFLCCLFNCMLECLCVHGVCQSGPTGDGQCICNSGYVGQQCDNVLCLECSLSMLSFPISEINPCETQVCDPHANCEYLGPGSHSCHCQPGYRGDGRVCMAVDPCVEPGHGGCPVNSTLCVYYGPGKSYCKCWDGYENLQAGIGCRPIDVCKTNNTCHTNADCFSTRGTIECICRSGYVGDGKFCYGSLTDRLEKLNTGFNNRWNGRLSNSILLFSKITAQPTLSKDMYNFLQVNALLANTSLATYISRVHIVPGEITMKDLQAMDSLYSLTGDVISILHRDKGRIHIDGIPVLHTDVQCQNGRLTIIDGVLLPQTILPILPHRCEKTTYRIQRVIAEKILVFNKTSCFYAVTQNGLPIIKSGCALYCNQTITPTCCKGFHGPDCLPCPGGFVTPCYGHGQCVDGHEGNGTCLCRKAFVGSACHVCARPDRHGPNCDLKCPCLHGECDNRPGSGGACRIGSCQQGLMGQLCDRSTVSCGPSGRFCHVHAECQSREGDLCVCKPGYRGDGATCEPFNPCNDPGNGGCHSNADCFSSGNGQALCTCIKGWTGDGRECYPIDNCQMPDKGNCHPNASCIYIGPGQSECRCSTGYRGDGMINCNPIDLCLENNGGCHLLVRIFLHIICSTIYSTKDFIDGMHRPSMLGPSFQLAFFHREKQLYVNNVPVTDPDIQTSRGVLHGIGQVLPVQRNRCDSNDTKRIPKIIIVSFINVCILHPKSLCCSASSQLSPKFKRRCIYFHYLFGKAQLMVGCRYICIKTLIVSENCCDGYFGKQCLPCPGTVDAWCNDHGVCSDGLNGTGQCICEEGFGGTACEQCLPDRYGKQCQQDCLCVKGRCQDGLSGDGSCECNVGYRGIHCDKRELGICILCRQIPKCVCAAGFTGNGTSCTGINACETENGGCSKYAICHRTKPGLRNCVCMSGFTGDGVICLEIDPCRENNGGCDKNAECTHIGPNKAVCNCLEGYTGNDKSCEPINPCKANNGGCSPFAKCNHTGPGIATCACFQNYIGDGYTCKGTILIADLSGPGPYTVLIPNHKLVNHWSKSGQMLQILRHHIVACSELFLIDLQDKKQVNCANCVVVIYHKLKSAIVQQTEFLLMLHNCLWQVSGLLALLNDPLHQPFTIFLPTDTALQQLPEAQKESLLSMSQPDMLQEVLKYHVIQSSKVTIKLEQYSFLSRLVSVLLVGEAAVRMVRSQLEFRGGVAHAIDSLLEPPSIGGRCDLRTSVTIMVRQKTWRLQTPVTLTHTLPFISIHTVRDKFEHSVPSHFTACPGGTRNPCGGHGTCDDGLGGTGNCTCPPEFNGTACELCLPGRYGSSCAKCECTKNGVCNEGIQGTGFCFCNESWTGKRCETKLGAYHSVQSKLQVSTFHISDLQKSVETDFCRLAVVQRCLQRNGGCHLKARCIQKGILVRCKCLQGFKGDGRVCRPQDLCVDGNNGGCSEHASCKNTGPKKRSCTCHADYVGDGEQCLLVQTAPVNRCLQNNGACSAWADCTDLHHVAGVYHAQSQSGRYQTTYKQAESRCAEDGATLATFDQLSRAQQTGLHMCSVGWLQGQHAAYPTSYSNPSCGFGKIGIIDYGLRNNASELWDAFCFRVKGAMQHCSNFEFAVKVTFITMTAILKCTFKTCLP